MTLSERRVRMQSMMNDMWFLERNLVSDGYDKALERLNREMEMTIHTYASGSGAWTWIVPNKWTCIDAYLERLNGERILDKKDNPLHCMSYSTSFEGIVSKDELEEHLHVYPRSPQAIPFAWSYYKSDWGLCCSMEVKDGLDDPQYKVVIKTEHKSGELKVGEICLEGETDQEIVLCAHLCHPHMANDDLSGVIVGMEVMRQLSKVKHRRYTYRLLFTPETIGSIAWLSSHEELIPNLKGGLFLEMLGTDCAPVLQMSYQENSIVDKCFLSGLKEWDADSWNGAFRRIIGNDERQFNAPGVRVPMLSLSRVFHPATGLWPYPGYHSSDDNPDMISWDKLEESVDLVLHLVNRLEQNRFPVNLFKGEVFCSRYDLFVDFYTDPEGNLSLFDIIQAIDGTNSVLDIAGLSNSSFETVMRILGKLEIHGLIEYRDEPIS